MKITRKSADSQGAEYAIPLTSNPAFDDYRAPDYLYPADLPAEFDGMKTIILIENCIDRSENGRLLARTTRKSYRWHLRSFAAWLASQELTPSAEAITLYMDHVQRPKERGGMGRAPSSTRAVWYALCFFDRWLRESEQLSQSMMPVYRLPKVGKTEPPVLSNAHSDRLVMAVETFADPFRKAIARAAFLVLTTATIRNGELCNLQVEHYDPDEKTLFVLMGKGDKDRTVDLCDACCAALNLWLKVRPAGTIHNNLFCWDRVRRLSDGGLRRLMREISHAAEFPPGVKSHLPHAMRHGGATRALENGEDVVEIMERLGHSKLETTQIYLHPSKKSRHAKRNSTAPNLDMESLDPEFRAYLEELRAPALESPAVPPPPIERAPLPPTPPPPRNDPRRHRLRIGASVRRRQLPE